MRTTNFDALATAAPLDRQASIVRDGSGDHWEAKIPEYHLRWIAPPALRTIRSLEANAQKLAAEIVGKRHGRLVVLGILLEEGRNKKARWVVRCDCGYYEARLAKTIRSGDPDRMMCCACDKADQLRQRSSKPSTGERRRAEEAMLDQLSGGSKA